MAIPTHKHEPMGASASFATEQSPAEAPPPVIGICRNCYERRVLSSLDVIIGHNGYYQWYCQGCGLPQWHKEKTLWADEKLGMPLVQQKKPDVCRYAEGVIIDGVDASVPPDCLPTPCQKEKTDDALVQQFGVVLQLSQEYQQKARAWIARNKKWPLCNVYGKNVDLDFIDVTGHVRWVCLRCAADLMAWKKDD